MKLFRTMMLAAGLVAFAQVASAQSLSAVSLHALATQPSLECGGCRFNAIFTTNGSTWTLSAPNCPLACSEGSQCNWLTQLVQHSVAILQLLHLSQSLRTWEPGWRHRRS